MASFSTRVEKERELLEAIDRGAIALSQRLLPSHNASLPLDHTIAPAPVISARTSFGLKSSALVPAIAGLVVGAGGAVLLGLAKVNHDALARRNRTTPLETEAALTTAARGASYQTLGLIGVGVGAASLIGAAVMFIFGKPPDLDTIQPSVAFAPSSASVAFKGVFP
jgi:hypothetical protein